MTTSADTPLGRGILIPFTRKGGDFVYGEGKEAIRSSIRQLLLTRKGDLEWNPDFGLNMEVYRHRNMDETLFAEVQADVVANLLKYEPRMEIVSISVSQKDTDATRLVVRVAWRAVARARQQNTVLTDTETTEVTI